MLHETTASILVAAEQTVRWSFGFFAWSISFFFERASLPLHGFRICGSWRTRPEQLEASLHFKICCLVESGNMFDRIRGVSLDRTGGFLRPPVVHLLVRSNGIQFHCNNELLVTMNTTTMQRNRWSYFRTSGFLPRGVLKALLQCLIHDCCNMISASQQRDHRSYYYILLYSAFLFFLDQVSRWQRTLLVSGPKFTIATL